jgi:hypothetical protein
MYLLVDIEFMDKIYESGWLFLAPPQFAADLSAAAPEDRHFTILGQL